MAGRGAAILIPDEATSAADLTDLIIADESADEVLDLRAGGGLRMAILSLSSYRFGGASPSLSAAAAFPSPSSYPSPPPLLQDKGAILPSSGTE